MALQGSGVLTLAQIAAEFGGGAPHALSEYKRGGGLVPNGPAANANIPTTNSNIAFSQFYGATNRIPIALTIASNVQDYEIWSNRGGSYVAGISDIILTINSGVYVGASSTGWYALLSRYFSAGDTVRINNYGYILGCGGRGGYGASDNGGNSGGNYNSDRNGYAGGDALYVAFATTIANYGIISGGGGGGGGADGNYTGYFGTGGGGGGGAGYNAGGGYAPGPLGVGPAGAWGASGGTLSGGGGGAGGYYPGVWIPDDGKGGGNYWQTPPSVGGTGGAGGAIGNAGSNGGTGSSAWAGVGGGGAAGRYVYGYGNVTWAVAGDLRGGAL